jgi:hypothetical protein
MKKTLLFILLFMAKTAICQTKDDIISHLMIDQNKAKDSVICFKLVSKFKSSIAEDTSTSTVHAYVYYDVSKKLNLRLDIGTDSIVEKIIVVKDLQKEFTEYYPPLKKYFVHKNFRQSGYMEFFNMLPIPQSELRSVLQDCKFNGLNGNNYFMYHKDAYFIKMDFKEYSMVKIVPTNNGVEFKKNMVSLKWLKADSFKTHVTNAPQWAAYTMLDPSAYAEKITEKDIGFRFPDAFTQLIKETDSTKKYYIVDLFYQSCLPCVASIPMVNMMYTGKNFSQALVIGVDPNLTDTMNMHKFIKRYSIQYPVITGPKAVAIREHIRNRTYPTCMVIDNEGVLRYYHTGILTEKDVQHIQKIVSF